MIDNQNFRNIIDKYFDMLAGFILNKSPLQVDNQLTDDIIKSIEKHLNQQQQEIPSYYLQKLQDFTHLQHKLLENKSGIEYLKQNIINWKKYKQFVGMFSLIFRQYDQLGAEIASDQKINFSKNAGYKHFKENFSQDIADQLKSYLFEEIEKERNGQQIESTLITEIVNLYYQLDLEGIDEGLVDIRSVGNGKESKEGNTDFNFFSPVQKNTYYIENFETKMLSNLKSIIENKLKNEWIKPTPEYVKMALEIYNQEELRAQQYYSYSKDKVKQFMDRSIILEQASNLVNHEKGVMFMLENNKITDLNQIYQLFQKIPQLTVQQKQEQPEKFHPFDLIAEVYQKFIVQKLIINEEHMKNLKKQQKEQPTIFAEESNTFISKLIDFIENDQLIQQTLGNELIFQNIRDNFFKHFLNQNIIYPRMLAACCDYDFKKLTNQQSVIDIEQRQKSIIQLYKYLVYKDIFLNYYLQQFQARNIKQGLSLNLDAELKLVTMLKTETGSTKDIRQLQQMIQDLVDSRDTYKTDFTNYLNEKMIQLPQLYDKSKFLILSYKDWSINMDYQVELPEQLLSVAKPFESYFISKYPLKRLFWIAQDSIIEIQNESQVFNSKKVFNFIITFEQYLLFHIIEKFNNCVTISQILKHTQSQMDPSTVYFHLAYLTSQQILTRSNTDQQWPKNSFDLQEVIKVNSLYDNIKKDVIFSNFCKANLDDLVTDDPEIKIYREYIVDSYLVIIMQSRKQLHYDDLIDKTVNMIKIFKVQPKLIKKRVKSLIERQYFKRDENNQALLIYIP